MQLGRDEADPLLDLPNALATAALPAATFKLPGPLSTLVPEKELPPIVRATGAGVVSLLTSDRLALELSVSDLTVAAVRALKRSPSSWQNGRARSQARWASSMRPLVRR